MCTSVFLPLCWISPCGESPAHSVAPGSRGPGKHPQLQPSTPRWAVANGAAVILNVCDDEVLRYDTAELTVAAVPALLLPPPATGPLSYLLFCPRVSGHFSTCLRSHCVV